MDTTLRYCGREFTGPEIETIQRLIAEYPLASRARLSRLVCEQLRWLRADGRLKDMSCRVAMLRMQEGGFIQLPAPRNGNGNGKLYRRRTPEAEPDLFPISAPAGDFKNIHLEPLIDRQASHLWNEYIDRYHYLGYQPLPGAQLRYFARSSDRILALLGFGAAAWKTAPRDRFISWTPKQREKNLHLVVNNARFLILPWVHSRNLASHLLAMAARSLADHWKDRYGYRPVLLETFVETPRFQGTCYKAANWIYLGDTQGRGKLDVKHEAQLPKKAVLVYPLLKKFRSILCS